MTAYDPDAIIANPDSHPVHRMYAAINIGIRDRGESWSKCANCGYLYRMDVEGFEGNSVTCSPSCSSAYLAYINNPDEF